MDRIREWSFPVALLTLWVLTAGYTFSSLGRASAQMSPAQKPVSATMEIHVVGSKNVSVAHKANKPAPRRPGA